MHFNQIVKQFMHPEAVDSHPGVVDFNIGDIDRHPGDFRSVQEEAIYFQEDIACYKETLYRRKKLSFFIRNSKSSEKYYLKTLNFSPQNQPIKKNIKNISVLLKGKTEVMCITNVER